MSEEVLRVSSTPTYWQMRSRLTGMSDGVSASFSFSLSSRLFALRSCVLKGSLCRALQTLSASAHIPSLAQSAIPTSTKFLWKIFSSFYFQSNIQNGLSSGEPRGGQGARSGTFLTAGSKDISDTRVKLLPRHDKPWYRVPHLLKLNLLIGCALQYSSATGYDGSMMNGVLSLSDWYTFMDNPSGAWLGFIAASAALGSFFG